MFFIRLSHSNTYIPFPHPSHVPTSPLCLSILHTCSLLFLFCLLLIDFWTVRTRRCHLICMWACACDSVQISEKLIGRGGGLNHGPFRLLSQQKFDDRYKCLPTFTYFFCIESTTDPPLSPWDQVSQRPFHHSQVLLRHCSKKPTPTMNTIKAIILCALFFGLVAAKRCQDDWQCPEDYYCESRSNLCVGQ